MTRGTRTSGADEQGSDEQATDEQATDEQGASLRPQRRGRRIAMSDREREAFLARERTCRVATIDASGAPHVSPLWFVWDGSALWLNSIVSSQRWRDLTRDPRVAVVVDAGVEFTELHGVEIRGRAEAIGEAPRTGTPDERLTAVEQSFADKYAGGRIVHDGRHAWLRIEPEKIVSWDFRKA